MAAQDQNTNPDQEKKHTPDPHEHPQNASGKAGKELSSDQNETDYDQSSESESLDQVHLTQSQLNPTSQAYKERMAAKSDSVEEEEGAGNDSSAEEEETEEGNADPAEGEKRASVPSEKAPVDRPIKDENGELL